MGQNDTKPHQYLDPITRQYSGILICSTLLFEGKTEGNTVMTRENRDMETLYPQKVSNGKT